MFERRGRPARSRAGKGDTPQAAHLRGWGLTRIEDATVITEFFQIVYAKNLAVDR